MTTRAPVSLPSYTIGTVAQPHHFDGSATREQAAQSAAELRVGDAAFIKRSDLKWTYAVVTERNVAESEGKECVTLRFEVDAAKNRKSFPEAQWGKYIRVIRQEPADQDAASAAPSKASRKKDDSSVRSKGSVKSVKGAIKSLVGKKEAPAAVAEPAVEEPAAAAAVAEAEKEPAVEEKPEPATAAAEEPKPKPQSEAQPEPEAQPKPEDQPEPQPAAIETKPSTGWFSGFFGGSPKPTAKEATPEKKEADTPAQPAEATVVETKGAPQPIQTAPTTPAHSPVKVATTPGASIGTSVLTPVDTRDDKSSKENYPEASEQLTMPKTFLPSPGASSIKSNMSIKRNPSSILKFKFGNKMAAPTTPLAPASPAVSIKSPPTSPSTTPQTPKGKEWFDPEASECDYDKNPTDLFQALEAREFEYAFEMYEQSNEQFTKDCKTWVIAKGLQKGQALRFRALPLHAAIVFDAPDELIIKILRAYPKASRGRDVKGRLPIHLAFEHQTSDQVIALIIDAFPKGFFAKDKKEMTPLDHVNGNTTRSYMARFIPQIIAAKIEEEREKWNIEANMLLEHQKATLQNDEEFMADVIQHVQEEVEAHNMSKIELLEANYQKEIELLKKKHDSETQALLEGFEVKLNFERKLNKLKVKQ